MLVIESTLGGRARAFCAAVGLGITLTAMLPATLHAAGAADSRGTDFWIAFPSNIGPATLNLFITGETDTTGTVDIPGVAFSTPFSVTAGAVTTVDIPSGAQLLGSDSIEAKGIHVTALSEVTVYGINRIQATTDAYLGLPTDILGTEYVVLGYKNANIINASEFAIVGTQDATAVTITPSVTTFSRPAGVAFTILLNRGDTYQLINVDAAPADLSGTIVSSDHPVAVFGGHMCANVPPGVVFCDHLVEELPPTTAWGKSFVTMPLATRRNGDTFRFIASEPGTTVAVNGAVVATLNRGQLFEQIVDGPAQITADHPIMVAQYSNGTAFDGVTSDPFMMLIPPFEQFLASYTVTTPASGFTFNFVNVVAPAAAVGSILLDGSTIPSAAFTPICSSGFSGAQLAVALGAHNLTGSRPFGVFVYGFDNADSYGYPGGMSLSAVATVTSVTLAPKTATTIVGTPHCVIATVKDQNAVAVTGVRVDFSVAGANSASGFANTDAAGQATFCYTGANTGTDTIVASVGTLSDSATHQLTPASAQFAAFNAKVEVKPTRRIFELETSFTLGAGSDGIAPGSEPVVVAVGTFTVTIPAGAFKQVTPTSFQFEGVIGGQEIEATISPGQAPNSYAFELEAAAPDPTGGQNPVAVQVTIGNDSGSTRAKVERKR